MKLLTSLAGGLAGAISVTILHELVRKIDPSAPRPGRLGERDKRRWLTVGLNVAGGLIAVGVTKWLERRASEKQRPRPARILAPNEAYKPVLDITV
ncbi:hypothetical protein HB364_05315 [Pseudoflavitalea sp. X16]|uniref:hypothetical protein n=1 Tax=Paraflavitalea devenefica TaxID=2716334 RepID=UPI00141EF856|nr:hypothetical protein [Paraflavitalea devenefica]NII24485.1 hypothetical protein [Paraflavitalea devenefica]